MERLQDRNNKMTNEEKIKAAKKRIAELKILIELWTKNEYRKN